MSLPDTTRATLQEVRLSWSRFERSRPVRAFLHEDWEGFSAALERFRELRGVDFIWENEASSESPGDSELMFNDPERFIVGILSENEGLGIPPSQFLPRLGSRGFVHYSVMNV